MLTINSVLGISKKMLVRSMRLDGSILSSVSGLPIFLLVVLLVVLLAEADLLASLVLRLAAEAGADANPAMKQRATSAANRRFIGCLR